MLSWEYQRSFPDIYDSANTNAVIAAFWSSLEIFQSELLDQVRQEVQSCVIEYTKDDLRYDIDRLLEQPILQ